jgi:hypothetical protein
LVGPEADFRTLLQTEMAEKPPLDHLIVGVIDFGTGTIWLLRRGSWRSVAPHDRWCLNVIDMTLSLV